MIPSSKKLFCKACNKHFELEESDYRIVKTIQHNDAEFSPIIVRGEKLGEKISNEDRKAYEEYFG